MRLTGTRPAPRCTRAFEPWAIRRAPVLWAMAPASASPRSCTPAPESKSMVPGPCSQVQKRCRWPVEHTPVAIRRARDHPLKEGEHAAHALDLIERGDEVHFRGSRIGEAHVHPAANQRVHQAFGTV